MIFIHQLNIFLCNSQKG